MAGKKSIRLPCVLGNFALFKQASASDEDAGIASVRWDRVIAVNSYKFSAKEQTEIVMAARKGAECYTVIVIHSLVVVLNTINTAATKE